jgi:hypothetical protein
MKFFFVLFVWALMAATLATGVVLAVNGHFWLLIVGFLAFIAGITKFGVLSH